MTDPFPWGSGPAPAHDCAECGRRLGKGGGHNIVGRAVLCVRCIDRRQLHAKYHPDCPHIWHDLYDHSPPSATRAGAWYVLARSDGTLTDVDGHPIVVKRRDDGRVHVDLVDVNGSRKLADLSADEAKQLARDIFAYLRDDCATTPRPPPRGSHGPEK